ncbi:nose resistant to fluoxetine protein 6-like [Harmonia axyridis]|uniref:nose resistant to fluoxetine protein 6-like n=1 Tax=Harmonia axyridis TaxID=115357 RepID=UPI001E275133|nr:nose resistant to fluoxetine protein 6-like [Harmonia axyridis]
MFKICFIAFLLSVLGNGNAKFNFEKIKDKIFEDGKISETSLMMLDASAKFLPNGILRGNFYNLGSYDGCLAIKDEVTHIRGKYCYATISIMDITELIKDMTKKQLENLKDIEEKKQNLAKKLDPSNSSTVYGFHFGVCIGDNVKTDSLVEKIPEISFNDDFCYTNERKLETKHWIALGVLGTIGCIALLSTIYDVLFCFLSKEPINALTAFSIYTNSKKLLKSSQNDDHLLCINGLRTLNMVWVIIGHVYVNFLLSGAIDNWKDAFDWMDDSKNMFIMGGTVSVDSFFTIGGLLTVYIYMKTPKMDLEKSVKSIPLMYLHRYLRLTPALAILVLVYATGLVKFLGDGPRWGFMEYLAVEQCEHNWGWTLLYLQNYISSDNLCIAQSWYLSVDMQLFLLSPLILIPLKKWPKYTLPAMVVLVGAGIGIPFYIGYSNKFTGVVLGSMTPTFTNEYYFKTHARFGPYVIGMLAGYLIHKMRSGGKKVKLNIFVSFIAWVLTIGALVACTFDGFNLRNDTDNALIDGMYVGFNRSIWSCALAMVVILCVSGNGGLINTFLSCPLMQFLSKLSYSMYLVHYLIILAVNLSGRDTMHFSNYEAIFQFFSFFILTVVVSVFYTLLFESPMIILERIIFSRAKK